MSFFAEIALAAQTAAPLRHLAKHPVLALIPGLALAGAVAAAAYLARAWGPLGSLSPMILAIALGILVRNSVGCPALALPGLHFAMRRLLRFAIILLGLQLTAAQIVATGGTGAAILAATVVATFVATRWIGRRLGVSAALTDLIAAGTSICGASAVVAANSVARGSDEDVTYAVACVTVFGSIAMLVDPVIGQMLALTPAQYGLWVGASIHEIAQVVAAAFAWGQATGEAGTVAKLARVVLLAPLVLTLTAIALRGRAAGDTAAKPPLPWFVLGFVALVAVNSLIDIPAALRANAALVSTAFLTIALAAMGLETSIAKLGARGFRPLILAACAALFIAGFSLTLIGLFA